MRRKANLLNQLSMTNVIRKRQQKLVWRLIIIDLTDLGRWDLSSIYKCDSIYFGPATVVFVAE